MKMGTTSSTGKMMKAKTTSGVKHGMARKNLKPKANKKPTPKGPTAPLKGKDRGGV